MIAVPPESDFLDRTMTPTNFFVPLTDQGLIRVNGEDATPFLHNLLTNDINHLNDYSACYAGLCTPKGRLIASFLIWREGADFLLQLSADILPGILKKLSMYVLRSKVKLADISAERVLIGIVGPQAEVGPQALMTTLPCDGGAAIRLDADRCVLALPSEKSAEVQARLASTMTAARLEDWHLTEIRHGIPRIVAATQEAFVPQMVNFELAAVGGVSFHKGCYPGQEIVARTHYLGKVKRRMFRVRLDAAFPPGTDVFSPEAGDQHCGQVVLTAPTPEATYESLLVVQISGTEAGEVHVGSPAGPCAQVLPLPYGVE